MGMIRYKISFYKVLPKLGELAADMWEKPYRKINMGRALFFGRSIEVLTSTLKWNLLLEYNL
jgi:hypothetical protein